MRGGKSYCEYGSRQTVNCFTRVAYMYRKVLDGQTEECKSIITSNKVANKKAYMTDLLRGTSY